MRTLVLRIANADALASVNIELALVNAAGQQTLDFATLQATAAALVDEEQVALKYEDSDGDVVTIASDADLREVIECMDDEDKTRLDVVIKTPSSIVKQHFLGLVAAVTKLANKMEIPETKEDEANLTVEDVMEMLYSAVEEWELAEDAEELRSIKADLLSLLDNEHLGTTVAELSGSEEYFAFIDQLLDAVKRGESVEDVVTSHWEAAAGYVKDLLVRCPELKWDLIRVAKTCVTGLALFNKELRAQEMMPTLELAADVEDEVKPATEESVAEDEAPAAAIVHEHFRCDGCDTSPIVGPRFRSSQNAGFDLCRACHSSGLFDAEHAPFTKYVQPQHVHFGVACDGCNQVPIAGVRYKALMVNNFDLCEACEASGNWAAQEPFIKIKNPSQVPQHIEVHIEPPAGAPQLHPFVTCDGCEMHPLVGKRYKSTSVHDFDLCERCHSSGAWTETHGPFDGVDVLNNFRGFKKWWKHEKKAQKCEKKAQKCFEKAMRTRGASGMHPPPPPPPGPRPGPPGPHPRPHPHPHPRPDHHGHHHHHHHHPHPRPDEHGHHHHGHHHHGHHGHHHGHRGHHGRHGHDGRDTVPVTASPVLAASFVEDVTIPDGTLVAPEVELVKAWKVKNTGTTTWPEGCAMKMQTGRFGVAPFDGEPDLINARVPPLASGEEFVVEVQLQTPSEPGRHTAYWRMCDPSDNGFGHRFWMDVVVSEGVSVDTVEQVESLSAVPVVAAAAAGVPVAIAHEENDGELVEIYSDSDDESAVEVASTVTTDDSSSESDSDKNEEDASDKSDAPSSDASEAEDDDDEEEVVVTTTATVSEAHSSHVEDVVLELCDEALVVLEAMGFGDRENNRRTLAQWGGNLADAVNSLLIDA